jgi:spore maturation protein CgeB
MRIFYASGASTNAFLVNSKIWRENLFSALVDLGHEVIEFDYDLEPLIQHADITKAKQLEFVLANRPKAEQELLNQITRAHCRKPIDLFFSYFYSSCITAKTISTIKAMGIKTMNWYCNASYQLNLVSDIAPFYDYCLVPEKFRLNDYKKLGACPIYFQEAANPNFYKPYDLKKEFDVTFIGAKYADRVEIVKFLIDNGINVMCWGPRWKNRKNNYIKSILSNSKATVKKYAKKYLLRKPINNIIDIPNKNAGDPLSDTEMVRTFSRSKICLGFSAVGMTNLEKDRIVQIRLRDFEVPMSGGFYMVEYMPELGEYFTYDKEIVGYKNKEDLLKKCLYYLQHEDEREAIRLAGYKRAITEHTWQRRFSELFKMLN